MNMVHTMYSDVVSSVTGYKSCEIADNVRTGELRTHIKDFERLLEATLDENCEAGLYSLTFHLLDHVIFGK